MNTVRYIYWQDEDMWLGYLEEFPDYMAQGAALEELQANLRDILDDLTGGKIPGPSRRRNARRMKRLNLSVNCTPDYRGSHPRNSERSARLCQNPRTGAAAARCPARGTQGRSRSHILGS